MKTLPISELLKGFKFEGDFIASAPIKEGLIHDSTLIIFLQDGIENRYVLQKINQHVFPDPPQVMENILKVCLHLVNQVKAEGGNPARETMQIVLTRDHLPYWKSPVEEYYRVYAFIPGTRTYHTDRDPWLVRETGRAFGQFIRRLADLPVVSIQNTIPNFHNTPARYTHFEQAMSEDKAGRKKDVFTEIEFLTEQSSLTGKLWEPYQQGILPVRIIHNDTKLNNVLFDQETNKAICVIDLDTVMAGTPGFDFGDALRFLGNTTPEDNPDKSNITFDLDIFKHFCEGYLAGAGDFLTSEEFQSLAISPLVLTYETALRFLTDYLNGDVYFRIDRPGHNLDRARSQIYLLQNMQEKYNQMVDILVHLSY
ncbi:MAG: aminoglycoside phosphotransferase family protein [Anaerolineales bacterium]|nr:aminoglycoside phosphotransferase family protein [Anaerolineales bacterium]